jgi:hypothetical protein
MSNAKPRSYQNTSLGTVPNKTVLFLFQDSVEVIVGYLNRDTNVPVIKSIWFAGGTKVAERDTDGIIKFTKIKKPGQIRRANAYKIVLTWRYDFAIPS